ncbi:MAG TPA: hypothetical protein VLK83_04860, partial [Rhodanobacteraceae bacterium]|nr:hypothetical protein [Rhodanobacteraceae bacterium]
MHERDVGLDRASIVGAEFRDESLLRLAEWLLGLGETLFGRKRFAEPQPRGFRIDMMAIADPGEHVERFAKARLGRG